MLYETSEIRKIKNLSGHLQVFYGIVFVVRLLQAGRFCMGVVNGEAGHMGGSLKAGQTMVIRDPDGFLLSVIHEEDIGKLIWLPVLKKIFRTA